MISQLSYKTFTYNGTFLSHNIIDSYHFIQLHLILLTTSFTIPPFICIISPKYLNKLEHPSEKINLEKMEYMIAYKTILPHKVHYYLEVGAYEFKRVKEFKCLSTLII